MEKCRKGSQKGVVFPAGKLSFFKDFDLGAPGVPKETTKLPKDGQGKPKGRPRVHKCLKKVCKWGPTDPKSYTILLKRRCNDTNLGHKRNYNTNTCKTKK